MPASVNLSAARDLDTAARLRVTVGRLSRRLRSTPAAREAGLTASKSSVLLSVVRHESLRLSSLAQIEGINPTMLSRIVAGLVAAKLLKRSSDIDDRRAAWVAATPKGRQLAERIRRERTAAVDAALTELSAEDRELIEASLPALEALAEQLGRGSG